MGVLGSRQVRTDIDRFTGRGESRGGRRELIDGRPVPLSPGSRVHETIARRVIAAFERQLRGRPWEIRHQALVVVDRWNAFRPDIAIVHQEFSRQEGIAAEPTIVAEVVGTDTELTDRGLKWTSYREIAALEHYLLIATDTYRVELYTRRNGNSWCYRNFTEGLHHMVQLPALDICLLLSEIYEGIGLEPRAKSST